VRQLRRQNHRRKAEKRRQGTRRLEHWMLERQTMALTDLLRHRSPSSTRHRLHCRIFFRVKWRRKQGRNRIRRWNQKPALPQIRHSRQNWEPHQIQSKLLAWEKTILRQTRLETERDLRKKRRRRLRLLKATWRRRVHLLQTPSQWMMMIQRDWLVQQWKRQGRRRRR